jgi:DNA-directed RNA polymerase subunit RPC12/RpoP
MKMIECAFCGNANVEKITDEHYNCSICGFGWNGKLPADMGAHLTRIVNLTKYLMVQNPTKSKDEMVNLVMEKLHGIENHQVDKHGYCEYCNTRFE